MPGQQIQFKSKSPAEIQQKNKCPLLFLEEGTKGPSRARGRKTRKSAGALAFPNTGALAGLILDSAGSSRWGAPAPRPGTSWPGTAPWAGFGPGSCRSPWGRRLGSPLIPRDKAEGIPHQGHRVLGLVIPGQNEVAAGAAAHGPKVDDLLLPVGLVAQIGGGQVLDGVKLGGVHHRLPVGGAHPQVKGGEDLFSPHGPFWTHRPRGAGPGGLP